MGEVRNGDQKVRKYLFPEIFYGRQEVHKYLCASDNIDGRFTQYTLFLICFTQKKLRTDRHWLVPNVDRPKMSPPIIKPVIFFFLINGIRGDLFGYQRAM